MEHLVFSNGVELLTFFPEKLMYATSDGHYTKFYFNNKLSQFFPVGIGEVVDIIGKQLPKTCENFIRVGRTLIVNKEYIYRIVVAKNTLELVNGENLITLTPSIDALKQLKRYLENRP